MADREEKTTFKPKITIVIGTLNRPQVVLLLINQLLDLSKLINLEVLVFDQSDEKNYIKLKKVFPNNSFFHLIRLNKPNTPHYLNLGWKKAKAPIVLYLDDDVSLTKDTVSTHIQVYSNEKILGVAGRVINDKETVTTNSNVGNISWYGATFTKNFSYQKSVFVDFPYGCNMSFQRDVLIKIGGFDEKLSPPIYSYNEIDLGIRINKHTKNGLVFSPGALVYHHQYPRGGTRNNFTKEEINKCNNFNYGYFVGKNFNWWQNTIFLIRRFPYQLLKEPKMIPEIIRGFLKGKKSRNNL